MIANIEPVYYKEIIKDEQTYNKRISRKRYLKNVKVYMIHESQMEEERLQFFKDKIIENTQDVQDQRLRAAIRDIDNNVKLYIIGSEEYLRASSSLKAIEDIFFGHTLTRTDEENKMMIQQQQKKFEPSHEINASQIDNELVLDEVNSLSLIFNPFFYKLSACQKFRRDFKTIFKLRLELFKNQKRLYLTFLAILFIP